MIFSPETTVFAILSFEGPDVYSQAGGLGVRVKGLSRALAQLGYETHVYFCGDPDLPAEEVHEGGRLRYRRWCQWISNMHRGGVYDGEDAKIGDWNTSLPPHLVDNVIVPAIAAGRNVVVMGEEWHTAWSMNLISDALYYRGIRDRVVMLWNANNVFSFHRINWGALAFATTLTTVSRYMKFKLWDWGQNPIVIPNGIPRESIKDANPTDVADLRSAAGADHFCLKIGRFDPDKRWLMAVAAMAHLKRSGSRVKLVMRGGREPHGGEVLGFAHRHGLHVVDVAAPADVSGLAALLRLNSDADVLNLTTFVNDDLVAALYASCDAVLANSGHEPFGLVGLEVMAAGGLAVTGSTGEDYAEPYRNALVLETDDPAELVTGLRWVKEKPRAADTMRKQGKATARAYTWDKVIEQLLLRAEFAAAQQAVKAPSPNGDSASARPKVTRRRTVARKVGGENG